MGRLFFGCALVVFVLGVLLVLMILGAMGVIAVPMKGVSVAFCVIAGVVFIVPLVLLWVIARSFQKLGKELGEGLGKLASATSPTSTPAEITLSPLEPGDWEKPSEVTRAETQFASLGFTDIGGFGIDEMPAVKMHAMMKQSESLWAIVYEMPNVGVTIDIVAKYEDDTSTTWTNAKLVGLLDPRPGHDKVREVDADAVGLYDLVKSTQVTKARKPVSAGEFKEMFERAYREEMEWRMSRGGATPDEVRRIALASGKDYSEETINLTVEATQAENRQKLEDALRKNFVESNQISAAKWESVRDRVVFIHEQLGAAEAMDLIGGNAPTGTTTIRQAFATVNLALPPRERFELLGSVEHPVPCDVYAMPED